MSTNEKVLQILANIKPTKDMTNVMDIIDGGYLDSFELLSLIGQLTDEFNIEIEIFDITPENFNSAQAITELVERLIQNK